MPDAAILRRAAALLSLAHFTLSRMPFADCRALGERCGTVARELRGMLGPAPMRGTNA